MRQRGNLETYTAVYIETQYELTANCFAQWKTVLKLNQHGTHLKQSKSGLMMMTITIQYKTLTMHFQCCGLEDIVKSNYKAFMLAQPKVGFV